MVTRPSNPNPYQPMSDRACVTSPQVMAERQRKLDELKKQFPDVDFSTAQLGPVSRSLQPAPAGSGNEAADAAARQANASAGHACDGGRIVAKPKTKAAAP